MFIHINQRVLINKSVSVITVIFLQLRYILFYMFGNSLSILHVPWKKQNKWDEDIGMTTIFKKRIYETCMKKEQDI